MPIGVEVSTGGRHFNVRMMVGAVLIIAAMALTFFAVKTAGHMNRYWVAKDTIVAGQTITPQMLEEVEANPGVAAEQYFRVGKLPEIRAIQTIGAGELLARSTVSDEPVGVKKLVVKLASPLPGGVEKGDYLEVWQLPQDSQKDPDTAELPEEAAKIAHRAVFLAEKKPLGAVRITEDTSVEMLVEESDLEALLAAVGMKQPLVAIPVVP